jgi:hypothetical protein
MVLQRSVCGFELQLEDESLKQFQNNQQKPSKQKRNRKSIQAQRWAHDRRRFRIRRMEKPRRNDEPRRIKQLDNKWVQLRPGHFASEQKHASPTALVATRIVRCRGS